MKRIHIGAVLVCALIWTACGSAVQTSEQNGGVAGDDSPIGRAFNSGKSGVQVEGEGVVTRILEDDLSGSRHQRFILRLSSGQTVLIAHNIDVAPRVAGIQEEDTVRFYGVYEWNEKAARFIGRTMTRKGSTWQVGSNTTGGPINSSGCVFLFGTQPNSLGRRAGRVFLNLINWIEGWM